uniref:Uncharacterized protein n=1 Tax=Anguilla anguilla TaxID=7936 RepID=A0A0E9UEV2_ANGAN
MDKLRVLSSKRNRCCCYTSFSSRCQCLQ